MFKIKFRIVDNIDEIKLIDANTFDDEYNDIEGFFQICIGQQQVGSYYHENPLYEDEIGGEYIGYWFNQLLDTVNYLTEGMEYVAFKDLETINRWIEFTKVNDIIEIRIAIDSEMKNKKLLITDIYNGFHYVNNCKVKISFSELKREIMKEVDRFFYQLKVLNANLLKTKMYYTLLSKIK